MNAFEIVQYACAPEAVGDFISVMLMEHIDKNINMGTFSSVIFSKNHEVYQK